MTTLRGRAATPVRPGLTAKAVLLGQVPLATGEHVSEASISDLHNAYKELIKQENTLRPAAHRLKPMTYRSFLTLFKFAQLLHLVELVREEPMELPPPGGSLLSIRGSGDAAIVTISARRIFKITQVGADDEKSWSDLCRAWREGWTAPQKLEYAPPIITGRPRKVEEEVLPQPPAEGEFKSFKLPRDPTAVNFRLLANHLLILDSIGADDKSVSGELSMLATAINSWEVDILDALDEARSIGYTDEVDRFEVWRGLMASVRESLEAKDIVRAVSALESLISG